jgi:hypothetical protein
MRTLLPPTPELRCGSTVIRGNPEGPDHVPGEGNDYDDPRNRV